jgi:glycosyltransferase involved in cell wall biosynthesis
MNSELIVKELMERNSCCIIIPTYNNAGTLMTVIQSVKAYSNSIIIVNDGSTDTTSEVIGKLEGAFVVEYKENKGKGFAIKTGFSYALQKGFTNAITFDSDGQHYARDIEKFLRKLEESGPGIIIGSRELYHLNKPAQNSFANRFSNFWFLMQTGQHIRDSQSGFRLYPIDKLSGLKFITSRYEFELEVLVRSFWKGVRIDSVPIDVFYDQKDKRISHFRPFTDFARISLLNTVLTILAIFYFRPKLFLGKVFNKNRVN